MTAASPDLTAAASVLAQARQVIDTAVANLAKLPGGVDENQVFAYDLAPRLPP